MRLLSDDAIWLVAIFWHASPEEKKVQDDFLKPSGPSSERAGAKSIKALVADFTSPPEDSKHEITRGARRSMAAWVAYPVHGLTVELDCSLFKGVSEK